MNIVITGGAGFLGARLASEMLGRESLSLAGAPPRQISRITLMDIAEPPPALAADPRVCAWRGDLARGLAGADAPSPLDDADLVVHLAAAVSGECEADFDLGLHANLAGTQAVLARCRASGRTPVVVFSSSVAVFGGTATHPMPDVITDDTLPVPQTSYGAQKFACEQLVADYTRKGFLHGRTVRLMTVSVRPGRPNRAASGFMSGIIREPLAGQRANCPVSPDTAVALSSPGRATEGLLCAAVTAPAQWGDATAVNLPPVTVTTGEMAAVLEQIAGPAVAALISWEPDPAIATMVHGWAARVRADRAAGLGLQPEESFAAIVRDYIREKPAAAGPAAAGPADPASA